jgi:alkyldihydroxyacetonephosphate synthase
MLIGSEGILGVITRAWMRVQDRPTFKESAGVTFDSFTDGARAVRALSQSGLYPSNCRLLDPGEAALTGAATDGALMVLGFESADHPLDPWMDRAEEICRDHGGRVERKARDGGGSGGTDAWASSPTRSRPRSPGTASTRSSPLCASVPRRRSPRSAEAARSPAG